MLKLLRRAETSGRRHKLTDLSPALLRQVDTVGHDPLHPRGGRLGDDRMRMSSQLLELSALLRRQRHRPSTDDAPQMKRLVTTIGINACDSHRQSFLMLRGDVLLLQLLMLVGPEAAEPRFHALINEVVQVLAELAISDASLADAFATQRPLIAMLFQLMQYKQLADTVLTLAQELLAVGPEVFPLSAVERLPELLTSLTPRGLTLVGRALAVLLAKAAEEPPTAFPRPSACRPTSAPRAATTSCCSACPSCCRAWWRCSGCARRRPAVGAHARTAAHRQCHLRAV